ncbi:unnamed protein product [Ostreobium quekettii]|uniref:DUF1092 family protein n=1 Tax=Ostreobium quekettii TaxID=121088 RepID=A0A8S1IXX6_9CHLO|nr:unnamed protein product [Ostreobium quekettii]
MASAGATRAPATCPCPHPGRLHPPRTSPWPRHCNAIHPRIPPQAIPPIGPSDANAATGDRAWHRCASALQEGSVTEASGQKEEEKVPMATVSQLGPSASSEWEVDFCSRPLLDERGKKVWELLVCNADRSFQHSEYFPNNKINSKELAKAFQAILSREGSVVPLRARYFRGQMKTIITRALDDLGIEAVPSRRCFAVMGWLQERQENVYKNDPRYSEKAQTLFTFDLAAPEALPDAYRAEAWNFVQLPLGTLLEELKEVEKRNYFGATISLSDVGLSGLPDDTLIPGVSLYSRRAEPLAAWMNGLEIATVCADIDRACLILDTGVNERYVYAAYTRTDSTTAEALAWEQAKEAARGLHFLAVQADPDAEISSGLWLLLQREMPN